MSDREIIVFDMDGVLVEVSESYRETICRTVQHFTGRTITRESIQDYNNQGGWNNDWSLSQKIASDMGVDVAFDTVVEYFNRIFFGENNDGLILREQWFAEPGLLERIGEKYDFAIFTGRLRDEADITLRRFANGLRFDPVIGADDVPNGKPAPDGLLKIRAMFPGRKLWYIGDTVDDARSGKAAGVPFIGIAARNNSRYDDLVGLLKQEDAIAILDDINQLETVLRTDRTPFRPYSVPSHDRKGVNFR